MNICYMQVQGNKVIRKIFDEPNNRILTQEMKFASEKEAREFVKRDIREPGVIYVED